VIEEHLGQLDQQMADLLSEHHEAVQRLAEVPGLGVDSAQQINCSCTSLSAVAAFMSSMRSSAKSDLVLGKAATIARRDTPTPPATAAAETAPWAPAAEATAARKSRIEISLARVFMNLSSRARTPASLADALFRVQASAPTGPRRSRQ
jgi:hypothetical protein